jgi:hypothetical protein
MSEARAPRAKVSDVRTRIVLSLLAAGLALASPAGGATELQLNAEAVNAVATIAGHGMPVRCAVPRAGAAEALGHADWRRETIELAPSVCRRVNALAAEPAQPQSPASYSQAEALLVLVHESVHLSSYSGSYDEALTECRAIQLVRGAALLLGTNDDVARALGHEAMRFDAELPGPGNWMVGLREIANYHSPDCYDGGPLDIHPDSTDWPN